MYTIAPKSFQIFLTLYLLCPKLLFLILRMLEYKVLSYVENDFQNFLPFFNFSGSY